MTNSIEEIKDADFIFVIGSNTTECHPIISLRIKWAVKRGASLVVADPRKIELTNIAEEHLQIKPGANIPLLNAMMYTILEEELWDQEFVAKRTEGLDELRETVANFAPELVEKYVGVPAASIRAVARGYAKAKHATILYTMGITQHTNGVHNVWSIANLAMLCGQIGKESSGVNPLRGQNNVQGACDMGALPNVLTGYQSVIDPAALAKFSAAYGVSLAGDPGLTVGEMLEQAGHGIKGMFIMGENPMLSDPDVNHVQHALSSLDFLVVQDIFLTETAALADVVLPGASFAEKDGTYSNTERRVQRVRKAIEPIGNAKADWQIICEISTAMGYPMTYDHPVEIFQEIASVTPSYAGISYDRLEQGGIQWPCPTPDHPGTKFLHSEQFTRGLGKFHPVSFDGPAEFPDEKYPLMLNTGRRLQHYHTGTMTRKTIGLAAILPEDWLEINPQDACRLGIADGQHVQVTSRRGSIGLKAKVTDWVKPGQVFTSFHFSESPANLLTNSARDPISKTPELKVAAVRVEKVV